MSQELDSKRQIYLKSDTRKAVQITYNKSEKGKLGQQKYRKTAKYKASQLKYKKSQKGKLTQTRHRKKRLATSIQFRLICLLRKRLWSAIKKNLKTGSAVRDLGCTVSELKIHLESKFQPGMTWDNRRDWHIDHIIPLASFNLDNREELLKAVHYSNLQPLWAVDNLKKSAKI